MEDLSHLADNSLWVSSMHGGNTTSSAADAMTAPGSPSDAVRPSDIIMGEQQHLGAEQDFRPVEPGHAPRISSPWNRADGSPWEAASDEAEPGGGWGQS